MSSFPHHARAAALALCLERERRAWRCGWALFALFSTLAAGALFCPAPAGLRAARQAVDFTGIRIEVTEPPAVAAAAPARPSLVFPEPPPVLPNLPPLVSTPPVPEALSTIDWDGYVTVEAESLLALELPEQLGVPATPPAATPAAAPTAPAPAATEYIAASYRSAPPPPYPAALRSRRVQGRVGLRIDVDAEGVPQEVEVITPSGYAAFDRTACDWVRRQWRFHPARRNGVAVASCVRTQVVFVLR